MSNSYGLHMFKGDWEIDEEDPQDFINGVERSFIGIPDFSETDKVRLFELCLKSGRAAKAWWYSLGATEKDTWEHLRTAFEERWPRKLAREKTLDEKNKLAIFQLLHCAESHDLSMFWGDGRIDSENSQDFINGVERSFIRKPNFPEKNKVRMFELSLKSGSVAQAWWKTLGATEIDTWEHLQAAFAKRWPERLMRGKSVEEQCAALEALVLKREDLGKRVRVYGADEFTHVGWANRLERNALTLKDDLGLLIPVVRRLMPRSLKLLVGTQYVSWPTFCDAIRKVSLTELEEQLEIEDAHCAMQAALHHPKELQWY
ncbi:hypothetical protein B0H34DRAFT_738160 [Crassisporium funariophilum]|nr:hypothetical protein B0H34DRAFT_738160 [Crassisporium funariophilum]